LFTSRQVVSLTSTTKAKAAGTNTAGISRIRLETRQRSMFPSQRLLNETALEITRAPSVETVFPSRARLDRAEHRLGGHPGRHLSVAADTTRDQALRTEGTGETVRITDQVS